MANTTQYNSTVPAITSILTGLYPKTHGNYLAVPVGDSAGQGVADTNLAHRMKAADYHCIAVTSHPSWASMDRDALLFDGWDHFSVIPSGLPPIERSKLARGSYTNERVFAALDEYEQSESGKALMLWVHYFDPHTDFRGLTYDPPADLRDTFLDHHLAALDLQSYSAELRSRDTQERRDWMGREFKKKDRALWGRLRLANGRAMYDAEILACDQAFNALMQRLDSMGIAEEALVIVCADHGENMEGPRDHREQLAFTHSELYEAVAHTPLIIKLPGQMQPARSEGLTQNIDILPTILELLDLPNQPPVEGQSLVALLDDPTAQLNEQVYIESSGQEALAVRAQDLKFISSGQQGKDRLYNLNSDPEEWDNLAAGHRSAARQALEQAAAEYRPKALLHLAVLPDQEPFSLELELTTSGTGFSSMSGLPASCLSEQGKRLHWKGTIDDEALMLTLTRSPQPTQDIWQIRRAGCEDLSQTIWIGKNPVCRTTVLPLWEPKEGPVPTSPQLELWTGAREGLWRFQMTPRGAQSLRAEFRCMSMAAWEGLAVRDAGGWPPVLEKRSTLQLMSSQTTEPVWASLSSEHFQDTYGLYRFDGRWPASKDVVLDGRSVAADELGLLFPYPPDGRIIADLRTGFFPDRVPPGSIVIWGESLSGGAELDEERIDPKLLEELRALGYAK